MRSIVSGARITLIVCGLAQMALSGCSLMPPMTTPEAEPPITTPRLPPKPTVSPEPEVRPEPVARPAPKPQPEPEPEPTVEPLRVAVLLTRRVAEYDNVATALRAELGSADIYDLADKSLSPADVQARLQQTNIQVVVAIGYRAAEFASKLEGMPVVYSQVFNTGNLQIDSSRVKGVAMLPPLDQQLEAWKALNPSLSSVGAIIGPGHEALLEEANQAGSLHGVRVESRLAHSDRETLYLFTRLVPQIDGYWLFPDNRILSPDVLRQMLSYAARHRVQIAVFNDSLLSLGATLSATAVDEDIARTILEVADQLIANEGDEVPAVSPLSDVAVNYGAARAGSSLPVSAAEGGR